MTNPPEQLADELITTNKTKHTSGNPLMRYAIGNLHSTVRELLPADAKDILEVGVGEGFSTYDVLHDRPQVRSFGGDLNPDSVHEAVRRFTPMRYSVFNAKQLPFPTNSMDAIYSLEVLEHIPGPEEAVREYMRVAREYLLVSVPNEPMFRIQRMLSGKGLTMLGDHPEHVNHWSLGGMQRFLTAQGLQVVKAVSPPPFAWSVILCRID